MNHDEFRARLDDYVDAAPDAPVRRELERHAQACADCARELAAVRALQDAAQQMPRSIEPPHDLWPVIEDRIRQQTGFGVGDRDVAAGDDRPQRTWLWGGALAATVVIAAVSAWLVVRTPGNGVSTPAPGPGARGSTPALTASDALSSPLLPAVIAALEFECRGAGQMLQASLRGWDTAGGEAVAVSLEDALREIDGSIAETRSALSREPDDPALLRLLTQRYQQKLALLHGAREHVKEV